MSHAYRRRLERDLDRWIAAGLVAPAHREAILADAAPADARMSAAGALGASGAALLGLSATALIMANWDGLARLARLALVLGLIWAGIGAAIWAADRRPRLREGAILFASLAFAAGIGLVGQMYQLSGEPWGALALAAIGAFALAFAGGAAAGAYAGAMLGVWAYLMAPTFSGDAGLGLADLLLGGLIGLVALARRRFEASPLLHALCLLIAFAAASWLYRLIAQSHGAQAFGVAALCLAALAGGVGAAAHAWAPFKARPEARTALGYAGWTGLAAFQGAAGLGFPEGAAPIKPALIAHAAAMIALAVWTVSFARAQRHLWLNAGGVVFAAIGALALLFALELDLLTIAAVFCGLALAAIAAALAVARRGREG